MLTHVDAMTHPQDGIKSTAPRMPPDCLDQPAASGTRSVEQWRDEPICFSEYPTSRPKGPAFGIQRNLPWSEFVGRYGIRRQGDKDGLNFIPASFHLEPDGRVRRQAKNLLKRTGVPLDLEMRESTGEVPPPVAEAVARIQELGLSALVYTSHRHKADLPRYRIILQLSEQIPYHLPAVEVMANLLGLSGVLDTSKLGASSLFFAPSAAPGSMSHHTIVDVQGFPIDAAWLESQAGVLLGWHQGGLRGLGVAAHCPSLVTVSWGGVRGG
jgi:hypothetical protein